MPVIANLRKPATLVVLGIFLTCTFFSIWGRKDKDAWIYFVYMDGRGYYSYLPAIFIYHDLTFSFYSKSSPHPGDIPNFCMDTDGKKVNKYFPGEAFLLSPFFFGAHALAPILGYPASGYSQPYYWGVGIAAVFYLGIGLLFTVGLLRLFGFSEWLISLVVILVAFATNLYHYSVYESSMSHVYSFSMGAMFLYYVKRLSRQYSTGSLVFAFLAFLLSFMIRPVTGFLLIFTIPFITSGEMPIGDLFRSIFRDKRGLITVISIGGLSVFGLCFLWYKQTGHWVVDSYPGETFDWTQPHTYDSLFSYCKGWLVYNPVMILALLGLSNIYRRRGKWFLQAILFVIPMIYLISAWGAWGYGYCYGLRAYVDHYPFMSVLLAFFLVDITAVAVKVFTGLLLMALVCLQQVQTWQAEHGIIHYADMNETRYRSIFLKTDSKWFYFFYLHPQAQTIADTLPIPVQNEPQVWEPQQVETLAGNPADYARKELFHVDFETEKNVLAPYKIMHGSGANSTNSYKLDSLTDYSPTFHQKYSDLIHKKNTWIKASVQVFPWSMPAYKDFALVACLASKGESLKYTEIWLDPRHLCIGNWNTVTLDYLLPDSRDKDDEVRVYCLTRGKSSMLIDNFVVELLEPKK